MKENPTKLYEELHQNPEKAKRLMEKWQSRLQNLCTFPIDRDVKDYCAGLVAFATAVRFCQGYPLDQVLKIDLQPRSGASSRTSQYNVLMDQLVKNEKVIYDRAPYCKFLEKTDRLYTFKTSKERLSKERDSFKQVISGFVRLFCFKFGSQEKLDPIALKVLVALEVYYQEFESFSPNSLKDIWDNVSDTDNCCRDEACKNDTSRITPEKVTKTCALISKKQQQTILEQQIQNVRTRLPELRSVTPYQNSYALYLEGGDGFSTEKRLTPTEWDDLVHGKWKFSRVPVPDPDGRLQRVFLTPQEYRSLLKRLDREQVRRWQRTYRRQRGIEKSNREHPRRTNEYDYDLTKQEPLVLENNTRDRYRRIEENRVSQPYIYFSENHEKKQHKQPNIEYRTSFEVNGWCDKPSISNQGKYITGTMISGHGYVIERDRVTEYKQLRYRVK